MLGRSISHYKIVRKLGEGGMGVVYEALDWRLNRPVAMKFLHPNLVDSRERIARLEQEALTISALNHPNIATIYGMEESEGERFLVLEYLPGGTLKSRLAPGDPGLPLRQALDYAIQIADGLAHAHEHGIVHRDIKSSNILFTAAGHAKIVDFSLARQSDQSNVQPDASGTPPFMSPEQAQGKSVDRRTDIFSFGVVLFEMLTGQRPFQGGDTSSVLRQVVHTPAPRLKQFRGGVPESLERIVSKALEKSPDARYQRVSLMGADLRSVRKEVETPAEIDRTVTLELPLRTTRVWWKVALAALLIVAPVLVFQTPAMRRTAAGWLHRNPIPSEKRLAVLMFSDSGAGSGFSDGLIDVLSSKLTQVEQFQGALMVVSPSEVRKSKAKTPSEAGTLLGATLAITGAVQKTGKRINVLINLVDTRTLTHLRSTSVEADYDDPTVLQEGIVAKTIEMLDIVLAPKEVLALQEGNTKAPRAYWSYVEGRGFLRNSDEGNNLDRAAAAFQKAIELDPQYALAYAGLADAWRTRYNVSRDPDDLEQAFIDSSRAVALNGSVAAARVSLGLVLTHKGKYEEAESEFEQALKREPVNAEAYRGLARVYEIKRLPEKAEATLRRAIDLRPNDWRGYRDLGGYYARNGRLDKAELPYKKVLALSGGTATAYNDLGVAYLLQGKYSQAEVQLKKSLDTKPIAMNLSNLGSCYYMQGRYKDAVPPYEKAVAITDTNSSWWGNLADAYRWTPEFADRAAAAYRKAIALGKEELTANPKDGRVRSRVACYYVALQDKENALKEIRDALKSSSEDSYVQFRAALVYEQLHERAKALEALRAAVAGKYPLSEIVTAPPLKNLRTDPGYKSIIDSRTAG
ncbi:MAG: protein kinase [Acidobacteriota bacterium]|nr:protein kinase [Acidobacteriota bacterium]